MTIVTLSFAAFLAGLLGSLHCIGMCGGIACSVAYLKGQTVGTGGISPRQNNIVHAATDQLPQRTDLATVKRLRFVNALKFNLGRVLTYSIMGGLVGFIGHRFSLLSNSGNLISALRIFSALLIALIGVKYLFGLRWIDQLEKAGQGLWSQLNKRLFGEVSLQNAGSLPLGVMWGFIPCGLVYTMLASSVAAGSALAGMSVMFAFGLGTLPAMLGMGIFSETLRSDLQKPWLQSLFGAAFILLALFLLAGEFSFFAGSSHHH